MATGWNRRRSRPRWARWRGSTRPPSVIRTTGTTKRLAAYLVGDPDPETVRDAVARVLPDYMVPTLWAVVDALPLTVNGKLDTGALPEPEPIAHRASRAPRTPLEQRLCAIVAAVLGLDTVGIDDDFFGLGGDSLGAIDIAATARREGIELRVRDLLVAGTVAAVAAALDAGEGEGEGGDTAGTAGTVGAGGIGHPGRRRARHRAAHSGPVLAGIRGRPGRRPGTGGAGHHPRRVRRRRPHRAGRRPGHPAPGPALGPGDRRGRALDGPADPPRAATPTRCAGPAGSRRPGRRGDALTPAPSPTRPAPPATSSTRDPAGC
ncbi:phosphopantetheine-binding protein [Pseudonocardia sp. ICBG601]|uniref:phosphopantetheine-binding protein n=1 Tax=Pseudonocardia sp. ICBG601 TaxID=2846759 RepID=UPI001CF6ECE9|nr:phosphopantetheine-binding protein [Pseudonocardia sp. ICBG601]